MYLTKEELRQHLLSAPAGTTPGGVIAALRAQGVQMEGDPLAPPRPMLEPVPIDQGPSVGGFVKNVAKSAGRLAGNVGSGIVNVFNPDMNNNTVANVGKLALGTVANTVETAATPFVGSQRAEKLLNVPGENIASNLGNAFVERYGDKGIAKTLYEDPVGALADVSTALAGGAGIAKLAGAGKVGAELSGLASAADPVANASRVVGKGIEVAGNSVGDRLNSRAEDLYQSALKPTKAVRQDFPTVVKTGLKNGIVLGKGSLDEVGAQLEGLRQTIDDAIETAAKEAGSPIATEDVLSRMQRAREFFKNVPGGSKHVDQLDNLAETFAKEQGKAIPIDVAQTLKKNTYSVLKNAYGELTTAHAEGLKDIARGLKEEIVTKVPEIKSLNLNQQELIGLQKALEDFMGRTGNRQRLDLGTGIGGVVGASANGVKGLLKGIATGKLLKLAFDDPAFKSWKALVYYRLGKGIDLSGKTSDIVGKIERAARVGNAANQSTPSNE